MAFKKRFKIKESIELVSLIDMIFILFIFFLVSSYVIQTPPQERGLFLPTPKNQPGTAQILVQIIDSNTIFWLDKSDYDFIRNSIFSGLSTQDIIYRLYNRNSMSIDQLGHKIDYVNKIVQQNPEEHYFILIRSPNDLACGVIMDIISKIAGQMNIEYGCIGGSVNDILNCNTIKINPQEQTIKIDL
ncbi:MAG: biopolymer transporter ExbD [bacterium]